MGPMTADVLLRALHAAGRDDALVTALTDPHRPGWAQILARGATFTWESWNARDVPGDSESHGWGSAMLAVVQSDLLGVRFEAPGAARIVVAVPTLTQFRAAGMVPTQRGARTTLVAPRRRSPLTRSGRARQRHSRRAAPRAAPRRRAGRLALDHRRDVRCPAHRNAAGRGGADARVRPLPADGEPPDARRLSSSRYPSTLDRGSRASSPIRVSPRSGTSARRAAAACTPGSSRCDGSMRGG